MLTGRLPISLGAACTVMDEIGGGFQGKIAFDRACPSVTQKRPLASHFSTASWVALGHENESTGLPESSKRHWKNESGYWRHKGGRQARRAEEPAEAVAIDGEAVAQGQHRMSARPRRSTDSGRSSCSRRVLSRRPAGIFINPFERGEIGPDLFRKACEFGLEGLVSKHRGRLYQSGRSKQRGNARGGVMLSDVQGLIVGLPDVRSPPTIRRAPGGRSLPGGVIDTCVNCAVLLVPPGHTVRPLAPPAHR